MMQDDENVNVQDAADADAGAGGTDGAAAAGDAADAGADTAAIASVDDDTAAYQQMVVADLQELRETAALGAAGTLLLAGIVIGCMIALIIRGWVHG